MPEERRRHEVEDLEQAESEARVKVDLGVLESVWADDLLINGTENIIYSKDHFLLRLKSGQIRYKSFERKSSKIVIRENVAIASGSESIVPATGPDADKTLLCSYLNVWIYGPRWQLIGRQVAIMVTAPDGASRTF